MNQIHRIYRRLGSGLGPALRRWFNSTVNQDSALVPMLVLAARTVSGKNRGKWVRLPVEWLDTTTAGLKKEVATAQVDRSYGPLLFGRQVSEKVGVPSTNLYEFENAIVGATSSAIWVDEKLILERVEGSDPARCNSAGGFVIAHGLKSAVIRQSSIVDLDSGLFLGGNGAFNYYHWLIEILPKLEYFNDPSIPLLVSEDVGKTPSFKEALDIVAGIRKIIFLCNDFLYRVKRLHHINSPILCPFNMKENFTLNTNDFVTRWSSLDFLRHTLVTGVKAPRRRSGNRVFLARKSNRRNYNQDETFEIFKRFGFERVHLEEFSLRDQIQAIADAEMIAGPTGAAWTNLVFANAGTKCLCWMADSQTGFAGYSNIAHHFGVELNYMTYPSAARSTDQLYYMDYHLDPIRVERELANIVGRCGDSSNHPL